MRLLLRDFVAGNHRIEVPREVHPRQQRQRELLRLVGHAGDFQAAAAQLLQRLRHALEDDRLQPVLGRVVGIELRPAAREVCRIGAAIESVGQCTVHEDLGTLADEGRDSLERQRRQAEVRPHPVGRGGQVRRGVHQRAVEVDQHAVQHRQLHALVYWRRASACARERAACAAATASFIASMVPL